MIIGIDARPLAQLRNGMRQYSVSLLDALAKIDKENKYILYVNDYPLTNLNNFGVRVVKIKPFLSKIFFLMHYLSMDKVDVFHSLAFALPVPLPAIKKCKFVVTIPDLGFEICPSWVSAKEYIYWTITTRLAAYSANRIIAISDNTKKDIGRFYKTPGNKISVTHCGVSDIFRPINNLEALEQCMKKYNLPSDFILYIASLHPRKNIVTLLKAFSRFKKDCNIKQKLVI